MARQHAAPVVIEPDGGAAIPLTPLGQGPGATAVDEATIQKLVHDHPDCLPVSEIDPLFAGPVSICRELNTIAGAIDNFLITPTGLPVLVECKLWRNPEGRREVVGQILDYAKVLSRWSASDLQREVSRRLKFDGNAILDLLRRAGHEVDETAFNDALTFNLRRGRFLLLIVGDGIREGVEAITEYLQAHAGLHFSLGLVEMPIFVMPDGRRLVVPRVLARTHMITRTVVAAPDRFEVQDGDATEREVEDEGALSRLAFWTDFVRDLHLDDPEQPKPRPGRKGDVTVTLPVPGGTAWITVYRSEARWEVGVYLSYTRDSVGAQVVLRLVEDWPSISEALGGGVTVVEDKLGRKLISDSFRTGSWLNSEEKATALTWLRQRTNDFVNVLRPRVRAAVIDVNGVS